MDPSCNAAKILFEDRSAKRENKAALLTSEKTLTYGELAGLAQRVASGLRGMEIERENRVAILMPDSAEMVAAFFGTMAIGAVPVPLNTNLLPADYKFFLTHSRAKVLIVSDRLIFLVQPVIADCPDLKHIIVTGSGSAPAEGAAVQWSAFLGAEDPSFSVAQTHPDEPAFWLYTSGSTRSARAVVHCHGNVLFSCQSYGEQVLKLEESDICFSAAKMFHAYGLGNSVSFPVNAGATTVLWHGPPLAEALLEQIEEFRATVFFGTPAVFVSMLSSAGVRKCDLSSLRVCVSAGEALPADTYEKFKSEFGLEIVDGIGSTELLHIFISNRPGSTRAGSSGQVVPGYKAKVLNESGEIAPKGEVGDLWVSGGSSALGYHLDKLRTQAVFRGEWVVTGDKYIEDADGTFWFQGRADDMLKINGLWVSPFELEDQLLQHPAVQECAVVGTPDANGLLQSKAFVVPKSGFEPSGELARELQGFLKQRLPQRYPRSFEFLQQLPRTATGKIQRFRLRMEANGKL
jgi:benzoate-CoA ligase